jgi:hypothetical protein
MSRKYDVAFCARLRSGGLARGAPGASGAETQIWLFSNELARNGLRVTIIVAPDHRGALGSPSVTPPGIELLAAPAGALAAGTGARRPFLWSCRPRARLSRSSTSCLVSRPPSSFSARLVVLQEWLHWRQHSMAQRLFAGGPEDVSQSRP